MGLPGDALSKWRRCGSQLSLSLPLSLRLSSPGIALTRVLHGCLVLSLFAFRHLQNKRAGCSIAGWLAGNAWAPEQLCSDVLGRVVGGQLLVALKVGGTCFD